MARGWESKSVEAQQAEANESSKPRRSTMTVEQAAKFREKEKLRLSRLQVVSQIAAATNPRHRTLLEQTLRALDEKLSGLE